MSAATVCRKLHLSDSYGISGLGILVAILGGGAIFVSALVIGVITTGRSIGRTTCRNWSTQTGFPSKFVILNLFDSGTCLAQAPNGRWVVNTKVVQFIQASKP